MSSRTSSPNCTAEVDGVKSTSGHRDRAVAEVGKTVVLAPGVAEYVRPSLGPAVEELDVVLLHESIAAVVVQGAFGGVLGPLGAEQERHGRELRRTVEFSVGGPGGLASEQLRAVERDRDVGQGVLDA